MIFPLAALATCVCLLLLVALPQIGVFVTLTLKPLIDASWDNSIARINCLKLLGAFVPILLIPRILFSRKDGGVLNKSLIFTALMYLSLNCLGMISMLGHGNNKDSLDVFLRSLNGFLGFIMIQHYVKDKRSFEVLLIALLAAGLFPMIFGVYQAATGQVWRHHVTSYGLLTRNVGLYHDAFCIRAYGYQTLTAILLSWVYFTPRDFLKKFGLIIYGVICSFVIFKSYSKAALVIFVAWIIIWSVFNRKVHWLLLVPVAFLIVNFVTDNRVVEEVELVFIKEIGAVSGTIDQKYVLAGRTMIWQESVAEWQENSTLQKIVGSGKNLPVHNEFLRHLIANGIIGLSLYLIVMITIGLRVTINMFARNSALAVMGFMVFIMWFVDNLGLHPGLYPSYQWYLFGFMTLALRGVEGLDFHHVSKVAPDRLQESHPTSEGFESATINSET